MEEVTKEIIVHGIEYIVIINDYDSMLRIQIEENFTGHTWKGEFNSKYIEDITQKTGNFKKYNVFIKMLISALKQDNDSVCIDILTARDLELLKSRKGNCNTSILSSSSSNASQLRNEGKRYFILTFHTEFEKVHYPLPLVYEENRDTRTMQRTIERLAKELEHLKSSVFEPNTPKSAKSAVNQPTELLEENEILKKKLATLESKRIAGAVEMDYLNKEMNERQCGYEKNLKESNKEKQTLRSRLTEVEKEVTGVKEELFKTRSELGKYDIQNDYTEIEELRSVLGDLSSTLMIERKEGKKEVESNKKILDDIMKDIKSYTENGKKLKVKMRQLETKLELATRRSDNCNRSFQKPVNISSRHRSPSINNRNNKKSNSVPNNRYNKSSSSKKGSVRSRHSPASSNQSNSRYIKNAYSPSNRLYSPNGVSRVNKTTNRAMPAVDRVTYMRHTHKQRSKLPPTTKINKSHINNTASGGNVFDRLTVKTNNVIVNKKESKANQYKPSKETVTKNEVNINKITKEDKENTNLVIKKEESASSVDERLKELNKELESVKVSDVDERLSKLQELIRSAKS